jgi:predicted NBD/HSP70 family sugar kinase
LNLRVNGTTAGALLTLVRAGRASTRTDLGQLTGMSRTAVSARVSALLSAGLLREAGELASTGGRPPGVLLFNADAGVVVGVAIGRSRSQVAVFDLEGRMQLGESHDHSVGSGPGEVMPGIAERVAGMLAGSSASVLGVGMSLPGTVNPERRVSLDSPVMRGWDGIEIANYLLDVTSSPIYLTNDTSALTRSQLLGGQRHRDTLVVKASTGLGLGLILDGRLIGADRGVIGELGHTKVDGAAGRLCRCGATGCLEAVASGWALTQELQDSHGLSVRHVRDVVGAALDGNPAARNALRESGRRVGEVLAIAVNLLNPDEIVLGGDMALAFEIFSAGVREAVYGLSTASATRSLGFSPAAHGENAGLVGCAAVVIDHELDAATVDQRLGTS